MNRGNYQKTPVGPSLSRIGMQAAATAIQQFGRALPCTVTAVSGQMVTVKFEVNTPFTLYPITIPIIGSQWLRIPVQEGDQGMTVACDTYLGGVSGLGGGVATMTPRLNMTSLAFAHISQTTWPASPNPNAAWINGPQGAILSDTAQTVVVYANKETGEVTITAPTSIVLNAPDVTINATTSFTINSGGKTWTFNAAGGTLSDGVVLETHDHLYTPGTGTPTYTGPPVNSEE
jgi:hypothetical protein